ncbi:AroM family protein [Mycobacterium heidelbergense]|uniref:AroM family protein n=1 Tax=Mycobacterium heidelbergense TaxID=53376 RepID=UPI003CF1E399
MSGGALFGENPGERARSLGVVVLGETPSDHVKEMRNWIPAEIVEVGVLDGLSASERETLEPATADDLLIAECQAGHVAYVGCAAAGIRIQHCVDRLEQHDVAATLIACTGHFAEVHHNRPLLFAEKLVHAGVTALAEGATLGLLIPDARQANSVRKNWSWWKGDILTAAAYPGEDVTRAAFSLEGNGAQVIVLLCMGYNLATQEAAQKRLTIPVLLARSLAARIAGEFVAGVG